MLQKKNSGIELVFNSSTSGGFLETATGRMPISKIIQDSVPSLGAPNAGFRPVAGTGGFSQTLMNSIHGKLRTKSIFENGREETLSLFDGGNISLKYYAKNFDKVGNAILVVPGVMSDAKSSYAEDEVERLYQLGWLIVIMDQRACGSLKLTSPHMYHGAAYPELGAATYRIKELFPAADISHLGNSLGAGEVIQFAAVFGDVVPVTAIMTISNVADYTISASCLESKKPAPSFINFILGRHHRAMVKKNANAFDLDHYLSTTGLRIAETFASRSSSTFSTSSFPSSTPSTSSSATDLGTGTTSSSASRTAFSSIPPPRFADLSDPEVASGITKAVRACQTSSMTMTKLSSTLISKLAGYSTPDEFLKSTSSAPVIEGVKIPLLSLNAADDPLLPGEHLPRDAYERSTHGVLAVPLDGGHIGFFGSSADGKDEGYRRWSARVVTEWFLAIAALKPSPRPMPEMMFTKGYRHPVGHPELGYMVVSDLFLRLAFMKVKRLA